MLKWLTSLYHSLTSSTAGETITKLKAGAEADYKAALATVEAAYAKDVSVVTDFAHKEMDSLEHLIIMAHERIAALLESGVDMGARNVDAAALHIDLTKAVTGPAQTKAS